MDLKVFDPGLEAMESGIEVPIKDPHGKETGIVINVASYESDRVKQAAREIGDEAIRQQRLNSVPTTKEQEDRIVNITVAAIVSWKGIEMDGKPFECTKENARALVKTYPFISKQIDAAAGDQAHFFISSPKD